MLPNSEIDLLLSASHPDPFSVLGPHREGSGKDKRLRVRAFLPGAVQVDVLAADGTTRIAALPQRHAEGFFEGALPAGGSSDYRLKVQWIDGTQSILDDPYRFPAVLGEMDVWLMGEGSHLRPYEVLGATQREMLGVAGTSFAVWAPNATRVSVVGDFNSWDGRRHPMRSRRECGVWEIFIPAIGTGAVYKYELRSREGQVLPLKTDPYALQSELRPATASVVTHMPALAAPSPQRQKANALDAPVSIYEVHLGSWRRKVERGNAFLDWDELADTLVPYARDMGFTHLELMPVSEHPFDGSWGYQPVGLYAPTSRFGDAPGFRRFVDRCHAEGLGLLLDWVPAHFPSDAHGLALFDGTHLYEHSDPREGFHQDWNTLIYNFGRTEVSNFLVANALYWLERYNVDGLRVDAVASMLYRDYSRKPGDWVPNVHGGRENLEAVAFLKRVNQVVGVERPQAVTLAEESTAFPSVSRPTFAGGLGFHYKWNMGWMHDTLAYIARDPIHRKYHHNELSFGLVYAFNENFVLPISHDEVVHGKGSLLAKMPGDRWQKFANLRAYLGFMFGHPGKKLLFMGCEFAQEREWNHDWSLDWHLLDNPTPANLHAGVQSLLRDLNHLYRDTPALYQRDFDGSGFEWIDHQDSERSVLSFIRRGHERPQADDIRRPPSGLQAGSPSPATHERAGARSARAQPPEGDEETSGGRAFPQAGSFVVVVCNFTPTVHEGFRVGVPEPGVYRERLNTDSLHYGGSNVGTPFGEVSTQAIAWNGRPHCIEFALPPLATVIFEYKAG